MRINYQHKLPHEEAYGRINTLLARLQEQYSDKISNPQTRWNQDHTQMDFSVEIMGFKTNGQVYLRNGQITLDGKLPFLARMLTGRIESMIKKQLEGLLS